MFGAVRPPQEPDPPPVTTDLPDPTLDESEKVFLWRRDELRAAGYPAREANRLAKDREIDLHEAIRLLEAAKALHDPERGLELALEILL